MDPQNTDQDFDNYLSQIPESEQRSYRLDLFNEKFTELLAE